MRYFACMKIENDRIPRKLILDEFVEYAAKLPISDERFDFQEIQFNGMKYIGIEIEHSINPKFPLEKIYI